MKNKNFLKKLTAGILGFVMTLGVGAAGYSASANETKALSSPYTMTIDSSASGSNNVHWTATSVTSLTYGDITWSTNVVGTSSVTSSKTYAQIGSKSSPATKVELSTTGFGGKKITSVAVTCYCMSNEGPTLTVKAGSTTFINASALTKGTNTRMPSTSGVSATLGSSDAVTITFNSSAKAAIAISKVEVSWETAVSNYNVSFNANGGSDVSMSNATTTGATYTAPANGFTPKTGYTFKQWALNSAAGTRYDAGQSISGISANIELFAIWNIGVTFNYKGHGTNTTSIIEAGTKVTKPSDPSVTGYTFGGWFTDSSCTEGNEFNFNNNVSAPTTVYAKWTLNSYNVVDSVANGTLNVTKINHGTQLNVTINPVDGYHIPDSESDIQVKRGNTLLDFTYTVASGLITVDGSLVTGDIEIIASCYKNYSVNITCFNCTANPTSTNIKTGGTATIEFTAENGYLLPPTKDDGISVSGADIDSYSNGTLIIKNPSDTVTVSCTCIKMAKKSITVNMDNHVKNVTGYGPDAIEIGGGATVHMEAADGYRLPSEDLISVTGAQATFSFGEGLKSVTITLSNCTGDVIISGSPIVRRTISTSITNGTANPSSGEVDTNDSWSTTLSPNEGYKLPSTISVTIGGESATGDAYTYNSSNGSVSISHVTGNVVISANMPALTVATISVAGTGSYASMFSYKGDSSLTEGGTAEITLTASSGYFITDQDIEVTGASKSYVRSTGKLTLSSLTADSVSVNVSPQKREVTSINITSNPTTTSYYLGESINRAGLQVMGTYNDGSGQTNVTSDCEISVGAEDLYTTGNHTATVTYGNCPGKTFNYSVQAKKYPDIPGDDHYYYKKVLDGETVSSGRYLITYDDAYALDSSLTTIDAVNDYVSISPTNNTIDVGKEDDSTLKTAEFTYDATNKTFLGKNGKYIYHTGSKNTLDTTTSQSAAKLSEVSVGSDNIALIKFDASYRMKFNSASDQMRFRFYTSGENVNLYKFLNIPESKPSEEKHVIRIKSATCTKENLTAGEPISVNDFNISVQYDTANTIFDNLKPTGISESTLLEGTHTYTLTFADDYGFSKTFDIDLTAVAAPILSGITLKFDENWSSTFTRNEEFNHNGVHVWASYSNGYADKEVTGHFDPPDMTVAAESAKVNVSYTENEVTKNANYNITINRIHTDTLSYVIKDSNENEVPLVDDYYNIVPGEDYTITYDFHGGDYNSVEVISGGTTNTTLNSTATLLRSNASTNETTTFGVSCDQATASIPVKVIASSDVTITSFETTNKGATAQVTSAKTGTFSGYIGNTASIELLLMNYTNPVVEEKTAVDGLSLTGSIDDGIYSGTITVNKALSSVAYVLTVSEQGGSDAKEITLTFSAEADSINNIKVTPKTTQYTVGDEFDPTMTIKATYASGIEDNIDSSLCEISGNPDVLTRGEHTITVSLKNNPSIKDQFKIDVSKPDKLYVITKDVKEIPGQKTLSAATNLTYNSNSNDGNKDSLDPWSGLASNKTYTALFKNNSTIGKNNVFTGDVGEITLTMDNAVASDRKSVYTFTLVALNSSGSETAYKASSSYDCTASASTSTSITISNIPSNSNITGWKLVVEKSSDGGNCQFYNLKVSYKTWVEGQPTYVDEYKSNDMTDTMYDFIYKLAGANGSNLTKDKWSTLEASLTDLTATDKLWFQKGAEKGVGEYSSLVSCDMFKNFINTYDQLVATQGLENYLKRDVLNTYTITIDYDNGKENGTAKVIQGEKYTLPGIPTKDGYVFKGWTVGSGTDYLQPGDPIDVSENITIKANWVEGIRFSSEIGFKFTGLDITRFQLIFNGTCPKDAESFGFLYTKKDIDLTKVDIDEAIAGNVSGVATVTGKKQAVLGTSYGSTTVTVVFYYVDADGDVQYSDPITMSFDSYVKSDKFDINIVDDVYAKLCLEYYIANLK